MQGNVAVSRSQWCLTSGVSTIYLPSKVRSIRLSSSVGFFWNQSSTRPISGSAEHLISQNLLPYVSPPIESDRIFKNRIFLAEFRTSRQYSQRPAASQPAQNSLLNLFVSPFLPAVSKTCVLVGTRRKPWNTHTEYFRFFLSSQCCPMLPAKGVTVLFLLDMFF